MKILNLNLKGKYFNQIVAGEKLEEYRLYNKYWQKRLLVSDFDKIVLMLGYPKKDDLKRRLELPWKGFTIKEIIHPEFGEDPVKVFAIKLA